MHSPSSFACNTDTVTKKQFLKIDLPKVDDLEEFYIPTVIV